MPQVEIKPTHHQDTIDTIQDLHWNIPQNKSRLSTIVLARFIAMRQRIIVTSNSSSIEYFSITINAGYLLLHYVQALVGAAFSLQSWASCRTWYWKDCRNSGCWCGNRFSRTESLILDRTCFIVNSALLPITDFGFKPGRGIWPGRHPEESQKSSRAAGAT